MNETAPDRDLKSYPIPQVGTLQKRRLSPKEGPYRPKYAKKYTGTRAVRTDLEVKSKLQTGEGGKPVRGENLIKSLRRSLNQKGNDYATRKYQGRTGPTGVFYETD